VRFAVLGAGAIGAYLGATLAQAGTDVTLIARGPHLQAMIEHGVRVQSPRGDFTSHPAATADIDALAEADVIVIGLKAHSLPELAPAIGERLRPGAVVVPAQNGLPWWYFQGQDGPLAGRTLESVDPGGVISCSIATERIVGCVVYCSTEIVEPGVIRHTAMDHLIFGELDGTQTARLEWLLEACRPAGFQATLSPDITLDIWAKFVRLSVLSGMTAVTRSPLGVICQDPELFAMLKDAVRETLAVAHARGIAVPESTVEDVAIAYSRLPPQTKSSMLEDLERGRRIELPWLSGAVVRIGREVGVETPTHRFINTVLKPYVNGSRT